MPCARARESAIVALWSAAIAWPHRSSGPGHFGERLRSLRGRAALSQEELAERAGMSAKAVSALERRERQRPYPSTVRALCEALELDQADRSALLGSVPPSSARPAAWGDSFRPSPSMQPPRWVLRSLRCNTSRRSAPLARRTLERRTATAGSTCGSPGGPRGPAPRALGGSPTGHDPEPRPQPSPQSRSRSARGG